MAGAARWDVNELEFEDANGCYVEVMPSQVFDSMWMSNGGGEQWLYTDLGKALPIEKVQLDWYFAPESFDIEVSDDATSWRKFAPKTNARFVRLAMHKAGKRADDEQIEEVAGGYIHIAMVGEHAGEWEVIDDNTGEVLGRYERVREAEEAADKLGMSVKKISSVQLKKLQNG